MGTKGKVFYRVVVSDSRQTPTSRVTESLGYYDPRADPPVIKIDVERANYWVGKGAQTSQTVRALIRKTPVGAA